MGAVFQGITGGMGSIGNELEGAKTGLRQERTQGQFDKLKMLQLALTLAQLQQSIKRANQPQQNIIGLPGGGTGVLPISPEGNVGSVSTVVPGRSEKRSLEDQLADAREKGDTGTIKSVLDAMTKESEAKQAGKPKSWTPIRGVGGLFAGVKSPDGSEYFNEDAIQDPQGKALFHSMKETEARYLKQRQEAALRAAVAAKGRETKDLFAEFNSAQKLLSPYNRVEDVSARANDYVVNPTGPGDVALTLAFVETTKPATGFRFTTTEQKMIQTSRGVVAGALARIQGGEKGTLFDDDQRRIIGDIVTAAGAKAKERKDVLLKQIAKMSPDVAAILTMEPGGAIPDEVTPPLPPGAELEQP